MSEQKLYSIGDMAKICNISARQLRYYDETGVVRPSYRNPDNGYRYYTEEQISHLVFLSELKNIGISNESIHRLFISRDVDQLVQELQINLAIAEVEIETALNKYKRLVNALVQNTRTLAYLHGNDAIESAETENYWISITGVPPMTIIYSEHETYCGSSEMSLYVHEIAKLNNTAKEQHLNLTDSRIGIVHEDGSPFELAREVKRNPHTAVPSCVKTFGGFNAVSTVSVGSPSIELPGAYAHMRRWCEERNLVMSDIHMEEYLIDSLSSDDVNRFVTKVYVPLLNYDK